MMRLFWAELRKLVRQPFGLAAIAAGFFLLIWLAVDTTGYIFEKTHIGQYGITEEGNIGLPYIQNIFNQYSEPYSVEYADKVKAQYRVLREQSSTMTEEEKHESGIYGLTKAYDLSLFYPLYAQITEIEKTAQVREEFVQQAENVLAGSDDPLQHSRASLAVSYYGTAPAMIPFYENGTENLIENYLCCNKGYYPHEAWLLLLCFLAAGLFSGERTAGTFPMIYTARYGRGRLYFAKITALCVLTFAMTIVYFAVGYAVFAIRWGGICGLDSAIQMLSLHCGRYQMSMFTLTIGEYLCVLFAMTLLYNLFAAVLAGAVSAISHNTLAALGVSGTVSVGGLVLTAWIRNAAGEYPRLAKFLSAYCPSSMLYPHHIFGEYRVCEIGETAVPELYVLLTVSTALIILIVGIGFAAYCRPFRRRK